MGCLRRLYIVAAGDELQPVQHEFLQIYGGQILGMDGSAKVTTAEQVAAQHVRQFMAALTSRGLQDTTRHDYARAIRTRLRFWHAENYIPTLIKFEMPKLAKKRLPVLTLGELRQIVKACNVRDKAIVLFMADGGLRRSEVIKLNWADINMHTGLVKVKQGKGKRDRSAVVGATTRRA